MTKAKPAPQEKKNPTPTLYDSRVSQVIPFTLTQSGRDYPITHTLKPIDNERYFKFQEDLEAMANKIKSLSTKMYEPKHSLWFDLIEAQTGYKERPDWIEKVHQSDAVLTVNALLHAQVLDESEMDETADDGLFDIDALTPISFRALFSGSLIVLTHHFRAETKAETDTFLAIQANEPLPNTLASAKKLSKAEKLYDLGKSMLEDREGYADGSDIPAWHLATTVESYFLRQLGRMGKFLAG